MIKILTLVGARPQFIKAAAISRCIAKHFANDIHEIIVHSGQHYDDNMSEHFFKDLEIPQPTYQFDLKNTPPLERLNKMRSNIEMAIQNENPDAVLLYGDTNTTLAGTYAATNQQIPIIHIEAGLRSYDESMPEENNRYSCDHASSLLFAPTKNAFQNLIKEGFNPNAKAPFSSGNAAIFLSGDVMYDGLLFAIKSLDKKKNILSKHNLKEDEYILATIHRNFNIDNPIRLNQVFEGFEQLSRLHKIEIIIPLHPRTKKQLKLLLDKNLEIRIENNPFITFLNPQAHFELLALAKGSKMIITDSGGLQKEAFLLNKACLIARDTTEWIEIIENKNAILYGSNPSKLITAYAYLLEKKDLNYPPFYGEGKAAEFICKKIIKLFNRDFN